MSNKKEPDPLPAKVVKILLTATILLSTIWLASQLEGYTNKLKVQKIEIENKEQTVKQLESKFNKVNENLNTELESKELDSKRLQELEQEKLRLEQELNQTKQQLQAKLDAKRSGNQAYAGAQNITGNKQAWLSASTIPESDWALADWLITRESSWRPTAQNPSSTAYGLKQFLDSTWAGVGCVKSSDPVYQLNCGQKYVTARYSTWANAKAYWSCTGMCTNNYGTILKKGNWY